MKDKIVDQTVENAKADDEGGGDEGGGDEGGGGGSLFGGGDEGGGDEGGGDEGGGGDETPPEENAGETPEEETDSEMQLLTAVDDPGDDERFSIKFDPADIEVPVKAQRQLDRALYNRSRIRTHGASKTHMPDFKKMTSIDNHAMEDPYDNDWIKSIVSNPFGEGKL